MLGVSLFISCKNKIQCVCVEKKKKKKKSPFLCISSLYTTVILTVLPMTLSCPEVLVSVASSRAAPSLSCPRGCSALQRMGRRSPIGSSERQQPVPSGDGHRLAPVTPFNAAPQKLGSSAFSHMVCLSMSTLVKQHFFSLSTGTHPGSEGSVLLKCCPSAGDVGTSRELTDGTRKALRNSPI